MNAVKEPVRLIRRSPGWEERLLTALQNGPVAVACQKDPRPRIQRLARYVGRGVGHRIPDRARVLLAASLQQARAEGESWRSLAQLLGLSDPRAWDVVRYYAGEHGGPFLQPVR